uniref:(northern house mosquito) hypothetical protein n=1 Tax=Culex pipiens TaxID=7175 RepID=A0A8D8GT39_CULPI
MNYGPYGPSPHISLHLHTSRRLVVVAVIHSSSINQFVTYSQPARFVFHPNSRATEDSSNHNWQVVGNIITRRKKIEIEFERNYSRLICRFSQRIGNRKY